MGGLDRRDPIRYTQDCGEGFQDFLRHNERLVRGSAICSSSATACSHEAWRGGHLMLSVGPQVRLSAALLPCFYRRAVLLPLDVLWSDG